jgi:hypothetical protein
LMRPNVSFYFLPYCFLFFPISSTLVFKNKNW